MKDPSKDLFNFITLTFADSDFHWWGVILSWYSVIFSLSLYRQIAQHVLIRTFRVVFIVLLLLSVTIKRVRQPFDLFIDGFFPLKHSFTSPHMMSIGFSYGDCEGHPKTFRWLSLNHDFVNFDNYFGSWYCCNIP